MWAFLVGLIKNPIFSYVADKTIGEVKHYLEIRKIERVAEINAMKDVSIAQVEEASKSLKDEWLTLFISGIILCCFIPQTQPYMIKGFEILKTAPSEILWAIIIVFMGSFGVNVLDRYKK
jgi:hypothetical protein